MDPTKVGYESNEPVFQAPPADVLAQGMLDPLFKAPFELAVHFLGPQRAASNDHSASEAAVPWP